MGKKRKYRKKIFEPKTPTDLILRAEIAEKRVEELRFNITRSEQRVKDLLDQLEYEYIFQYALFDSFYFLISDFFLSSLNIMIEVDGNTPNHTSIVGKKREKKRKTWLRSQGIEVIRIKNGATVDMTTTMLKRIINRTIKRNIK